MIKWIVDNLLPFEIISPDERGVRLKFGRITDNNLGPGCHWYLPLFAGVSRANVNPIVMDLADKTMTDNNGDTYSTSGTVEYSISNVEKALYGVQDFEESLGNHITALISDAVFEAMDKPEIEDFVMKNVQKKADKWGLSVTAFMLNEHCKSKCLRIMGVG